MVIRESAEAAALSLVGGPTSATSDIRLDGSVTGTPNAKW